MRDSFAEFLARLQTRDDTAALELFERFAGQLIALARRRLAPGLGHKVDPESVVQSAFTSFIQRYLQIGYNRAARIVERMEKEGVVTAANHVGKHEVLARDIDNRER